MLGRKGEYRCEHVSFGVVYDVEIVAQDRPDVRAENVVLGFEIAVKSLAHEVGLKYDLLHADLVVRVLLHKLQERIGNLLSGPDRGRVI